MSPDRYRPARLRPAAVSAAIALAAAVALWFRLPPVARDTLWAEDGRLFLAGAEAHGLAQLFVPYAGYLQVVPRLVAAAVVPFPVVDWAVGMTAGSCLVAGAAAALVYGCAAPVVPARPPRLLLAATTVLLPLGPRDVLGNAANLHTVLLWTLFWICFATPVRVRTTVALSLAGLLCALSEIQTVFLVPLLVLRLRGRGRLLAVGPLLGIAAELVATVAAPRVAAHAAPVGLPSVVVGYLVNGVVPLAVPIASVGAAVLAGGLWLAAGALLVAVVVTIVLWRGMARGTRLAVVSALVLGPLVFAASVVVNPAPYYDYATMTRTQLAHPWLTRYGVAPGLLFLAVVVLLAAEVLRRRGTAGTTAVRIGRPVAVAALVAVAVCCGTLFVPSWTRRSDGPRWSPQIAAATAWCDASGATTVRLRETLGWRVPVPCARLREGIGNDQALWSPA